VREREKEKKMSSSTFNHRWTSVNDLTTNNNQLKSFFLQSSLNSNTFNITLRPSQSLVSLIEPTSFRSSSPPPPIPPRQFEKTKASSSRVADMIHRFESHNHNKTSPPIRSFFTKQWEENFPPPPPPPPRTAPIVVVETTPTANILFHSKEPNKRQPIIVCERITNHDRSHKSLSTPPPVNPKSFQWLQNKITTTPQNVESDTDSAIQTMAAVINDSTTLSRSNTTESSCSSSSSASSIALSTPHFALPTLSSTQKQRDITINSTSFKRTCSPPPPPSSVTTFTRPIPSTHHENFESTLSTRLCASEINLVDQYRRLSSPDVTRSDTNLSQKFINTNLPLKYKRDSYCRLYG
jgi:hypothetical protein